MYIEINTSQFEWHDKIDSVSYKINGEELRIKVSANEVTRLIIIPQKTLDVVTIIMQDSNDAIKHLADIAVTKVFQDILDNITSWHNNDIMDWNEFLQDREKKIEELDSLFS